MTTIDTNSIQLYQSTMGQPDPGPRPGSFLYQGRHIAYTEHGTGSRALVLIHGLLMDQRMYTRLAPEIAGRGYRVITVDLLGHGASEQPHDMTAYCIPDFGRQVIALLDHLAIDKAVVGGTSLGANVALEVAVAAPARVTALVVEMPVLENALPAAAGLFVPLALALRTSQPLMRLVAALTRRIPRTHFTIDIMFDWVRRDPRASLAVLDGILFGRVAPPVDERRRITQPTLVIGHRRDPVHPFSDADLLARELPAGRMVTASSIVEWRLRPARLDAELAGFLDALGNPSAVAAA